MPKMNILMVLQTPKPDKIGTIKIVMLSDTKNVLKRNQCSCGKFAKIVS